MKSAEANGLILPPALFWPKCFNAWQCLELHNYLSQVHLQKALRKQDSFCLFQEKPMLCRLFMCIDQRFVVLLCFNISEFSVNNHLNRRPAIL